MKTLIGLLLFIPVFGMAQTVDNERPHFAIKEITILGAAFYAGFKRHERDVIDKAYYKYKKRWPNANDQWANPIKGRFNKYKLNDPTLGYKEIIKGVNRPVAFSDKYHMSTLQVRLSYSVVIGGSMALWHKPNWKQIVVQTLLIFGADAAGNGFSSTFYKY